MGYGDVIKNITAAWVAALLADDTYGQPVAIDLIDTVTFTYESDTSEIKSGGMIAELSVIPTKAVGTIKNAGMSFAPWSILTGFTATEYGNAPSKSQISDIVLGGDGLPYAGLIVAYASQAGSNLLVGFPKFMLNTIPGLEIEQNQFRVAETEFTAIAPSLVTRKAVRYGKYQTATQIPTTAAAFKAWFTSPINMFA